MRLEEMRLEKMRLGNIAHCAFTCISPYLKINTIYSAILDNINIGNPLYQYKQIMKSFSYFGM